mgnify:CR=1 FL=1
MQSTNPRKSRYGGQILVAAFRFVNLQGLKESNWSSFFAANDFFDFLGGRSEVGHSEVGHSEVGHSEVGHCLGFAADPIQNVRANFYDLSLLLRVLSKKAVRISRAGSKNGCELQKGWGAFLMTCDSL